MKNVLKYTFMSLAMIIYACGDNDKNLYPYFVDAIDSDALNTYTVSAIVSENPVVTFTIINPLDCKVESDQAWCDVDVESFEEEMQVTLSVENNTEKEERVAKVTLSSPDIKKDVQIEIKQEGFTLMELRGLDEDIKPEGETRTITVMAGGEWSLSSEADWVAFDKPEGRGVTEVNVTILPNEDGIIRMASIKLKNGASQEQEEPVYEILQCEPWETQVRIGDSNPRFDSNKLDANYPQMREWMKAGVEGGIPSLKSQLSKVTITFESGASVKDINGFLNSGDKYAPRIILLKNGNYTFDQQIRLYAQDVLIGESRDGVVVTLKSNGGFSYYNASKAGIRNLSIEGDYRSYPPDPTVMEETLIGMNLAKHATIEMKGAVNCYIDNVKMKNIASHAFVIGNTAQNNGRNNTVRDLDVDGAYNKGGYMAYLHIGGSYNLITGCRVVHLRHISMQDPTSFYNVFYKNDVEQEVSFHNDDGGDNLVEYNRITLPETLKGYTAIMGPWSIQHKVGGKNFVYRNKCLEVNNDNKTPWSDNELYIGPWEVKPVDLYTQFRITDGYPKPIGRTFYPVILK